MKPPVLVVERPATISADSSLSAAQGVLMGAALGGLAWSLVLLAGAALYFS